MHLPDVARGYYRSTRFEWGVLAHSSSRGTRFYGPWFSKYDPAVGNFEFRAPDIVVGDHNRISGPVEEFSVPLGYDEAKAGGTFVKIGVGHLRKPADGSPYRFSNFYDVVDPGKWTSKIDDRFGRGDADRHGRRVGLCVTTTRRRPGWCRVRRRW